MKEDNTDVFTLGHSPDPDDAFMFYAMAQEKNGSARVPVRASTGRHYDVERACALRGELHISAISIHAYTQHRKANTPCCPAERAWATATGQWLFQNASDDPTLNVQLSTKIQ